MTLLTAELLKSEHFEMDTVYMINFQLRKYNSIFNNDFLKRILSKRSKWQN